MNNSEYCVQVFAKAPIDGFCKTRLGAGIGAKNATAIHEKMIADTLSRVSNNETNLAVQLWCKPDVTHDFFQEQISKHNIESYQQKGDSLGAIMEHASWSAFKFGYKAILQIGTDCPDLDNSYIAQAIEKLESNDIVIGPAIDGGYVLLAQKKYYPEVFSDIEWGTSLVLTQLVNNIEDIGLNYTLLSALNDIDTIDDFKKTTPPNEVRQLFKTL